MPPFRFDQLGASAANALTSRRALPLRLLVSLSSRDHVLETEMSASGQSRRFYDVRDTSAFPPIAAVQRTSPDFAFVPEADSCSGAISSSDRIARECRDYVARWANLKLWALICHER